MSNPYELPKVDIGAPRQARSLPFDIGGFVGRYLQVLAWVSIALMAVNLLFFDRLRIDLWFVFLFWAGACLMRHNPTARKWVIGISGLAIFFSFAVLYAVTVGSDAVSVTIGIGRRIDNLPIGYGVVSCLMILAGIPLVLLLTQQARDEFTSDE